MKTKRQAKAVPLPALKENGWQTVIEILARITDYMKDEEVILDCGEAIYIPGYVAMGLEKIFDGLNPINKEKMLKMSLLELLNVYVKADEEGVLSPMYLLTQSHGKVRIT